MGSYRIGDAMDLLFEKSGWKQRVHELRLHQEWDQIMGTTIARYTKNVRLKNKTLTIHTEIAALKQELSFGKEQLISRINEYFKEVVVSEIIIR